jgi:hypothetical protein
MIFVWLVAATLLHVFEEYVYPGGFLSWMRSAIGQTPTAFEAVVINLAFVGWVAMPLFSPATPTIWTLSVPSLLLANGALHVVGTIVTRRYSPGVVTSVALFFPLATYALVHAGADSKTVSGGILLGIGWMCVPLTVVMLRKLVSRR